MHDSFILGIVTLVATCHTSLIHTKTYFADIAANAWSRSHQPVRVWTLVDRGEKLQLSFHLEHWSHNWDYTSVCIIDPLQPSVHWALDYELPFRTLVSSMCVCKIDLPFRALVSLLWLHVCMHDWPTATELLFRALVLVSLLWLHMCMHDWNTAAELSFRALVRLHLCIHDWPTTAELPFRALTHFTI